MDLDEAKQIFIIESKELLEAMEHALLGVEGEVDPSESINAIFRAVHTIKGSAGLFALNDIVRFTHTMESVLDLIRSRQLTLSPFLISAFLECHDYLDGLILATQDGAEESPESRKICQRLVATLVPYLEKKDAALPVGGMEAVKCRGVGREISSRDCWHLSLRFARDVLKSGMDPLSFIRYLGRLGRILHLTPQLEFIPKDESFDPELCYLGLELDLDSEADRQTILDVFEFVREGSMIRLLPPHSKIEEYIAFIQSMPQEVKFLGEMLVAGGTLTAQELEESLHTQKEESSEGGTLEGRRIGAIFIEDQAVPRPVVAAALEKQKKSRDQQAQELRIVKVQADKLDRLVDLVGELVIAGATAKTIAAHTLNNRLMEVTTTIGKLVEEIRDSALSLRMVQLIDTFNRFPRIVRDMSKELGKVIELEIHGGETELDKTIVEKLGDPLMHIVRNAIDHGIEPVAVRRALGKPDNGLLILNAYHESGTIVIEVSDDGGGLSREKILAKAIQRGLVSPVASLTDAEIYSLIFEPGFSTAESVTQLSGRGVGMDVVRRNIDEMRGSIEIDTEEGLGTTLRIRLPLTLAIIDGFMVGVEDATYVIPLNLVIECLDLETFLESEENHLINLRGEVLPFLRIREVFRMVLKRSQRERVVVVQYGETRAGIVVDRLMGELQTVIKPLSRIFAQVRGIGGSTILGSGDVALVLDVPQLIQLAAEGHSVSKIHGGLATL